MKLGVEVGLGPGHIVLDGDPAPPKGAQQPPLFLALVYCGQTAGWIRMPLGTEALLGPSDIVQNYSHYFRSHITNFPNFVR